jgi:hypothetical protein
MKNSGLYDCFEEHLMNLEIVSETHDLFVTQVVENFLLRALDQGFVLGHQAEDTYTELRDEVSDMLRKRIYGHFSLDAFRFASREDEAA